MNATEDTKERMKQYNQLLKIGLGTVVAVITLISGTDKVKTMLAALSNGAQTLRSLLPVVLFFQTILLGVSWYVSGDYEINLLSRYYGKHAPRRAFSALPVVIFAATAIVVLAYYSDKILVYSSLYAVYLFIAIWTSWLTSQHVIKALRDAEREPSIPELFYKEIYLYYVRRPAPVLGYVCGAITFAAIACAAVSRTHPGETLRLETISYIMVIGAILVGESFVWSWRARLYNRTKEA